MRVTLDGHYSIDEFADAVDKMLQNFRCNGVEEIFTANIYCNLRTSRRAVRMLDEEGIEIKHLRFDGPRSRPFRKVTAGVHVQPLNEDLKDPIVEAADKIDVTKIGGPPTG